MIFNFIFWSSICESLYIGAEQPLYIEQRISIEETRYKTSMLV